MPRLVLLLTTVVSFVALFVAWRAASTPLSQQKCRMSWMSPSYILQTRFNKTWSPLGDRYSLWLYREVGWEDKLHGQPVLFIPGNAGSSRQVRSIASSSTRQYYSNPNIPALSSPLRPVDYFTVDFNEDFSALHGTTLEAQRSYSSAAVDYILSLYPQGTSIILMGHSMGGIVATGLLPHPNVSAVITMSSPHALPPARFDRRIADFYARTRKSLAHDPTPILSLCGGATDGMIPSEYCILPVSASNESMPAPYRRTVFTTALEGAWTGVGHQVMVWCHQVRWRIARAAIQLAAAQNLHTREAELDKWLSDGLRLPPLDAYPSLLQKAVDKNSVVDSLVLRNPTYADSKTYFIPIPQVPTRFVLWLGGGVILPVHPAQPISLSAYVRICPSTDDPCTALQPNVHRMLPHPFPAKKEDGVDESEGVVAFETDLNSGGFVSVEVLHGKERGFLTAGFASIDDIVLDLWTLRAIFGHISISLNPNNPITYITLPNLRSHSLLAYRIVPTFDITYTCVNPLLPPLLTHTSPSEVHHYPLAPSSPIYLHAHTSAPYLYTPHLGTSFTIRASPGCAPVALHLTLDGWRTLGRLGPRLWPALAAWAVAVTAYLIYPLPQAHEPRALEGVLARWVLRDLWVRGIPAALILGALPLPPSASLGTQGELIFAPLAPLVLVLASGVVCILWTVLRILLWAVALSDRIIGRLLRRRASSLSRADDPSPRNSKTALLSTGLIFALVALVVPWQVAFLGCWILHLHTCATRGTVAQLPAPHPSSSTDPDGVPLQPLDPASPTLLSPTPSSFRPTTNLNPNASINHHILLLLTTLLPLAAPVLAVWVRTLLTAGFTTPFDGDHNLLAVAPFLLLVDFASWTHEPLLPVHPREQVLSEWSLLLLAGATFIIGARETWRIFEFASFAIAAVVAVRIGPRYWGRPPWGLRS